MSRLSHLPIRSQNLILSPIENAQHQTVNFTSVNVQVYITYISDKKINQKGGRKIQNSANSFKCAAKGVKAASVVRPDSNRQLALARNSERNSKGRSITWLLADCLFIEDRQCNALTYETYVLILRVVLFLNYNFVKRINSHTHASTQLTPNPSVETSKAFCVRSSLCSSVVI